MDPAIMETCQLAEVDFEKAVSDPVWQLLFLENPNFVKGLPADFKLLLLRSIYSKWGQLSVPDEILFNDEGEEDELLSAVNNALEVLDEINVELDPWETEWPGVAYSREGIEIKRRFEIGGGWFVDVCFADCDIEMKDVEYGCNEQLSLTQWLEAFFNDPDADIRTFAETCGLSYEPAMSPEDGWHFRFTGFTLNHSSGESIELPAYELGDTLDADQKLAHRLEVRAGSLESDELESIMSGNSGLRPIFDGFPSVDEETSQHSDGYGCEWHSPEGIISLTWKCNCWLPVVAGDDSAVPHLPPGERHSFIKQPVDIVFDAHGNSGGSYEITYSRYRVGDAEPAFLELLNDDRLSPLYLHALDLPFV